MIKGDWLCWRIIGDRVLVGDGQGGWMGGSGEECRGYWMMRVIKSVGDIGR